MTDESTVSSMPCSDHPRGNTFCARVAIAARAVACFLGIFILLNLLAEWHTPGFDANLWWIDLHPLPRWTAHGLLVATSLALLLFAFRPRLTHIRAILIPLIAVLLATVAGNTIGYYRLLARHVIRSSAPVPFSMLVGLALLLVLLGCRWEQQVRYSPRAHRAMLLVFLGCLVLLPLAQIACFGTTDYRRPADAIVVFGAQAHADGTPSRPLAERVATACRLYRAGYAPLLVFSGGPGDGSVSEPQTMRRMALALGVPDRAILTDECGLNTRLTVQHTCPIFAYRRLTRIIAVSHFYHLPRIKMTYQRAGWNVYTVPAEQHHPHAGDVFPTFREVAGLWVYYLTGLLS